MIGMNRSLVIRAVLIAVIVVAAIFVYEYTRPKELEGKITVSGAFALYPMIIKWAAEFTKLHPKVRIDISAGGAGKGMSDALAGLVDLGMISREISSAEEAKGAVWVAVAKDAVVMAMNAHNPVVGDILAKGLKRSTFIAIYIYGNITTWGEVVGRPEVTDVIHLYTRSDSCGAGDTWAKYLGKYAQDYLKGIGVYGDPGIADAIKNDPLGIGYNNLNYAYDNSTSKPVDGLAIIPLDINANGVLDANESFYGTKGDLLSAIATGAYPSPPARELYLVTKDKFTGLTAEFVKWILTDGQQYESETGYIPLSQEMSTQELSKLG